MQERQPSRRERINRRFKFLSWPLTVFDESVELRKHDFPLKEAAKKTRFPVRALRYWWAICAIQEETRRLGRSPIIADAGCDLGTLKRFSPDIKGSHWVGMDLPDQLRSNQKHLELARYDKLLSCNLDSGIPLSKSSVDIVICLHVLEHLPRPEFTIRELARILRPGGLMLLGYPVLPRGLAHLREWQFSKQLKSGKRKQGGHIQAFWPSRSRRLAEQAGLQVEFMVGSHLFRKSGSHLENHSAWIRLNQIWGALFPSLGREICIQLRRNT
ncbi:MAG: class I SAM-dependent methyltransferase [Deltaproteobacteria bacterium]|nr:class I SAM-dependent methyltransferase [Deltaproteobacteria bacterium]